MRHRNELAVTLTCMAILALLMFVLCFFVGARWGVQNIKKVEVVTAPVEDTTQETTQEPREMIITHEYVYTPLPVDYEPLTDCVNVDETDAVLLAKTLWGEYRDSSNYPQCAAVCQVIINRVNSDGFGDTIKEVVTAPYQFQGYSDRNPVDAELYAIAVDVLSRNAIAKYCVGDVGLVLTEDYLWFEAAPGMVNAFRNAYRGGEVLVP